MAATDQTPRREPKIHAPFTAAQVTALNTYQRSGSFHPFTCGRGQDGGHVSGITLTATEDGWRCPVNGCTYHQDWAWSFMAGEA